MKYFNPKRKKWAAVVLCGSLLAFCLQFSTAQQAPADGMTPAQVQMIRTIQEQQKKMTGNMDEMEKKVSAIHEDVRQARIFVSRGG